MSVGYTNKFKHGKRKIFYGFANATAKADDDDEGCVGMVLLLELKLVAIVVR